MKPDRPLLIHPPFAMRAPSFVRALALAALAVACCVQPVQAQELFCATVPGPDAAGPPPAPPLCLDQGPYPITAERTDLTARYVVRVVKDDACQTALTQSAIDDALDYTVAFFAAHGVTLEPDSAQREVCDTGLYESSVIAAFSDLLATGTTAGAVDLFIGGPTSGGGVARDIPSGAIAVGGENVVPAPGGVINGPSTIVHEFGHAFGLEHTFLCTGEVCCPDGFCVETPAAGGGSLPDLPIVGSGECAGGSGVSCTEEPDGSNCLECGDFVCDTPADPGFIPFQVTPSCDFTSSSVICEPEYDPSTTNVMSYSRSDCRDNLTPGQLDRLTTVTLRHNAEVTRRLVLTDDLSVCGFAFRGTEVVVPQGITLTVENELTLGADATGRAARLVVEGRLAGQAGSEIALAEGAALVVTATGDAAGFRGTLAASGVGADGAPSRVTVEAGGRLRLGAGVEHAFLGGASFFNQGGTVTLGTDAHLRVGVQTGPGDDSAASFEAGPGARFFFEQGAGLAVYGTARVEGTAADTVSFRGMTSGVSWDGILLEGDGSRVQRAFVSGAEVGVTVRARDVELQFTRLRGNGTGVASDFVPFALDPQTGGAVRSDFELKDSWVEANEGVGVLARNVEITEFVASLVRDNGGHGLLLWNAASLDVFDVDFDRNGGGTAPASDGVRLLFGAELDLANRIGDSGELGAGNDRVRNNAFHELYVGADASLFVGKDVPDGLDLGGLNVILDDAPADSSYLIYNASGVEVLAELTYWGSEVGPDSTDFFGPVDYKPFLILDPTTIVPQPGNGSSGDGGLRQAIRSARQSLQANPGAPGAAALTARLYGLQRLDRTDALGERAQTMALLAWLRAPIGQGGLSAARQATAEEALRAEVTEAVIREDYPAAEALLAAHAGAVTDPAVVRSLDYAAAVVDEQAGRYAAAAARLETVARGVPSSRLERDLNGIAGMIAAKGGGEAAQGNDGGDAGGTALRAEEGVAEAPVLGAARPNPTAGTTALPLVLPAAARVEAAAFDVLGRRVALLHEGPLAAGRHRLVLGAGLPAGVYVVRAVVESGASAAVLSRRVTVIE